MSASEASSNVFFHRHTLYSLASQGKMGTDVIEALLPKGVPLEYERELWDYKLLLPQKCKGKKLTAEEAAVYDGALCEIIKDVVAFHNSYGGYIVVGVKDSPKEITGFDGDFDCDEFNKRVTSFTGRKIQCYFEKHTVGAPLSEPKTVGLLYIPKRADNEVPVQFTKDAVQKNAKRAFSRDDIYLRVDDQCIPAQSTENFALLYTPGKRVINAERYITNLPILDTNLGPRDPGFIDFVGREAYISRLWKWFVDRFNPVKLLAGIGGVGKTALAREFSEQVARAAPFEFQKIVWLSAKKQFYTAVQGKYVASTRVDFEGTDGLLRQICLELGMLDDEIQEDTSREELIELTINALKEMPALVIVDDIDSLEPDQQQDTFHALLSIFSQTIGKSPVGSRALLTSRLDLGAGAGQVIRVKGLEIEEFVDFVNMTAEALDLHMRFETNAKRTTRFHAVTEGSPTFASSVLRLVSLGEPVEQALSKWQNADGEEVRRFAFQRELDQLSDAARATLYALCILSESHLLELSVILTRSEQQIRDDFAELRRYHLITHFESHLPGGNRISVPSSIRMMKDILKEKIKNPKRIELNCAKARSQNGKSKKDIGYEVKRIVSLWSNGAPEEALEHSIVLDKQYPNHPDVKCLLGRAYLQIDQPDPRKAEISLRAAHELECRRSELLTLWIKAKSLLGDWNGLLDITEFTDKKVPDVDVLLARANAVENLAQIDLKAGNVMSAAMRCRDAGTEINNVFKLNKATGAVIDLKQARKNLLSTYFYLTKNNTTDADKYLDVWLTALYCFDSFVRSPRILYLGLEYLQAWWTAVERRENFSEKTEKTMRLQLDKLNHIKKIFKKQEVPDTDLVSTFERGFEDLNRRFEKYIS
ncbi:RNA-binding domain-containing protein [Pseudomonas nitroreducens]|uniref:RNA-binding domain-containing protein n=1 Tax=Pseudomonas nitroreducens TaxID=46680 RepID=UPI001FB5AA58|nr:RNA-binding domain-containing protein [Pseudomonas nitroreducens]MCJ1880677.1 putative DNA binding domain-containing protein [Pseudomonas nitroreducens]MCJ1893993.1 putative DNA binding domain-containing protein [Pseudomonas nitroreducens]MDP5414548.1 putative DNA binding domain-containing protein [Pseudomonas aeruginosa]HBN8384872.1 putative DNA binding domain-containing protein [Pseudomonas aeruginosa]